MLIIPAIDIKDGRAVRLWQGDFARVKEYSRSPQSVAREWQRQGAEFLHIVDLDGARSGRIENLETIKKIAAEIDIPFEVGGGVRDRETIAKLMDIGALRVVLGTRALEDRDFLKQAIEEWRDSVIVSVDAREGRVAGCGWQEILQLYCVDFARELKSLGARMIIYTDISRDGTLCGPNIEAVEEILDNVGLNLIASGGISSLEDLRRLKRLADKGLKGVIVGKALYEGKFSLKDALRAVLERC